MKLKFFTFLILPASMLVFFSSSKIDPNNPPTGRTGAPGETTCQASGCHTGGNYSGTVEIIGIPDTVVANEEYTVTLNNESNAIKAGFQLTALNGANQKTGTMTAGTGCSIGNSGGRQYMRQSSPHTLSNGSTAWTFKWKAPATVVGDSIHFYFTSLCANGNGQKTGDNVLVSKKSSVLPPAVSATNGIEAETKLLVYPNPAYSTVNIDFLGKGVAKIVDANGEMMLEANVLNHRKLDVSGLKSGIYFVKIESNLKTQFAVFIKQ